jgi:hypothetical protein
MNPAELPPTLARLGDELEQAFENREAADRLARGRRRRRLAIATAAGALMLVPVAVATKSLWEPGPSPEGRAAVVARGTASTERWRLSAYGDDGRLCLRLTVSGGRASQNTTCHRPTAGRVLDVRVAPSVKQTYVFGAAPPDAVRVDATLEGAPAGSAQTASLPDSALDRADITGARRFYVVVIDRLLEPRAPLHVAAVDSHGRTSAEFP